MIRHASLLEHLWLVLGVLESRSCIVVCPRSEVRFQWSRGFGFLFDLLVAGFMMEGGYGHRTVGGEGPTRRGGGEGRKGGTNPQASPSPEAQGKGRQGLDPQASRDATPSATRQEHGIKPQGGAEKSPPQCHKAEGRGNHHRRTSQPSRQWERPISTAAKLEQGQRGCTQGGAALGEPCRRIIDSGRREIGRASSVPFAQWWWCK